MPTFAVRAKEGKVRLERAFNLSADDFTPVHLRFKEVLDHALHVTRHVTGPGTLRSLDHGILHLVAQLLLFFFTERIGASSKTITITVITAGAARTLSRYFDTVTFFSAATATVHVNMNVDQVTIFFGLAAILLLLEQVIINLFSAPAVIFLIKERLDVGNHTSIVALLDNVSFKSVVDYVVASDVPELGITSFATHKVFVDAVSKFVRNKKHVLLVIELENECRVVIELLAVSCCGRAPLAACRRESKAKGELTEKRMLKEQTHASFDECLASLFHDLFSNLHGHVWLFFVL